MTLQHTTNQITQANTNTQQPPKLLNTNPTSTNPIINHTTQIQTQTTTQQIPQHITLKHPQITPNTTNITILQRQHNILTGHSTNTLTRLNPLRKTTTAKLTKQQPTSKRIIQRIQIRKITRQPQTINIPSKRRKQHNKHLPTNQSHPKHPANHHEQKPATHAYHYKTT